MTSVSPRGAVREVTAQSEPRRSWRTGLFGRPLATADAPHETIGKAIGLAVFSSDALSSTAYATQEILVILAAAGTGAFHLAFPISIAIAALLIIVTLSYEQTIYAYPGGGGAYIVARDNIGDTAARIAAAALLTDYILTVAVSVSAGVAQLASGYPFFLEHKVALAVVMVLAIALVNLRGVRESGALLAVPTFLFIVAMYALVGVGFWRYLHGSLGTVSNPPELFGMGQVAVAVTPFLILHAFASGTAALTGVEAISNGVTAFREPRSRNAGLTLLWMAGILGTLFLGLTYLAWRAGCLPSEVETVTSQLARTVYVARGAGYYSVIWTMTMILVLGANTAFAGFPRLAALCSEDGYLPRQLTFRGSRLVYSRGIVALALIACLLIVIFDASVTNLIPLYAIGVFLSFTLSQAGMAKRWYKCGRLEPGVEAQERGSVLRHERGWRHKLVINSFGAVCTCVVMVVFAYTKFHDGAWMVLLLLPLLVWLFVGIHRHYRALAKALSLEDYGVSPALPRHRVILPISGVHRGTLKALQYALSQTRDITAVYVALDGAEAERVKQKWLRWGDGTRLVVLESPYRLLLEPLLEYVETVAQSRQPNEIITIVVPEFVPTRWYQHVLHSQTATWLRLALLRRPGIVVTDVPYVVGSDHLDPPDDAWSDA